MSKLQQILHQTIKHQTQDKKQLVKINERIRALLDIKRYEHDDKVSQYLRVKNKEAKVKRTKQLRKHHLMTIYDNNDIRQSKKMSLESLKVCSNGVDYKERIQKQRSVNLLKQFEEDFTGGKMDEKYEEMLEEYIYDYSGVIDNNREAFIKKATKDIKQKLFNYYVDQKTTHHHHHPLHKLSDPHPFKQITLESATKNHHPQYVSIETTKTKPNKPKQHMRVRSEDQIGKHLSDHVKPPSVPYILKSPSKFNKVQSQSIYQVYLNELGSIDQAKRVNEKKRRMKEHSFLMRLREFNPLADHKK